MPRGEPFGPQMKTYFEKLKDPRWQRKRLEIMQRDDFKCRTCNSETKTLNVHHIRYFKGREPWDYRDWYLVTLCEDCHKKAEDEKKGHHQAPKERSRLEQMMADAPNSPPKPDHQSIHDCPDVILFKDLLRRQAEIRTALKQQGLNPDEVRDLCLKHQEVTFELAKIKEPPPWQKPWDD
jgi:hypothetical protein